MYNSKCPECGCASYTGFSSIECSNLSCSKYKKEEVVISNSKTGISDYCIKQAIANSSKLRIPEVENANIIDPRDLIKYYEYCKIPYVVANDGTVISCPNSKLEVKSNRTIEQKNMDFAEAYSSTMEKMKENLYRDCGNMNITSSKLNNFVQEYKMTNKKDKSRLLIYKFNGNWVCMRKHYDNGKFAYLNKGQFNDCYCGPNYSSVEEVCNDLNRVEGFNFGDYE